jgi:hypothetical protein
MDLLAEVNGKTTLLDWKTGKAIYREAHLQNAAYRFAVLEMKLIPVQPIEGMIVRLPKTETDPEFEIFEVKEPLPDLLFIFEQVHGLWKWLNAKEELKEIAPEAVAG